MGNNLLRLIVGPQGPRKQPVASVYKKNPLVETPSTKTTKLTGKKVLLLYFDESAESLASALAELFKNKGAIVQTKTFNTEIQGNFDVVICKDIFVLNYKREFEALIDKLRAANPNLKVVISLPKENKELEKFVDKIGTDWRADALVKEVEKLFLAPSLDGISDVMRNVLKSTGIL